MSKYIFSSVLEAFRFRVDPQPKWFQDKVINKEIVVFKEECIFKVGDSLITIKVGDYVAINKGGKLFSFSSDFFEGTFIKINNIYKDGAFDTLF